MSKKSESIQGTIPIPGSGNTRKRGCSSPASSKCSVPQNYRFKRAVVVGKRGGSTTPVPIWKLLRSSRSPSMSVSGMRIAESPKHNSSPQRSGERLMKPPVSARKLAATLWEMNEVPSPSSRISERVANERRRDTKDRRRSGSLPPHLSDPSLSPVSERTDRSGTGSRMGKAVPISHKTRHMDHNFGVLDSLSNGGTMEEIESRSRAQTPSRSSVGIKSRLKDVSNALMTSKELLKIISRIHGHEERPSSSMSLLPALHAELERARLQVNQLIHEQPSSDQNEMNYLIKCFAEEKAAWKRKEQEVVDASIESIVGELEVERKLRRQFEGLNKKLGKELAEMKACFIKTVKELENEKRAKEVMEQMCNKLALEMGEEKVSKTSHQIQERNELRNSLKTKKSKEERTSSSRKYRSNSHYNEDSENCGEVEDASNLDEESAESDLHSINIENNNKGYKWARALEAARELRNDTKGRWSTIERVSSKKSSSLQRSVSEIAESGEHESLKYSEKNGLSFARFSDYGKYGSKKGYEEEISQNHKQVKDRRDRVLATSGPIRQRGQLWPALDSRSSVQERPPMVQGSNFNYRLAEVRGEGYNARRSNF